MDDVEVIFKRERDSVAQREIELAVANQIHEARRIGKVQRGHGAGQVGRKGIARVRQLDMKRLLRSHGARLLQRGGLLGDGLRSGAAGAGALGVVCCAKPQGEMRSAESAAALSFWCQRKSMLAPISPVSAGWRNRASSSRRAVQ